jgi:hypothetical protein
VVNVPLQIQIPAYRMCLRKPLCLALRLLKFDGVGILKVRVEPLFSQLFLRGDREPSSGVQHDPATEPRTRCGTVWRIVVAVLPLYRFPELHTTILLVSEENEVYNTVCKCKIWSESRRRFVTEITANSQSKAYVFEAAALSNASI